MPDSELAHFYPRPIPRSSLSQSVAQFNPLCLGFLFSGRGEFVALLLRSPSCLSGDPVLVSARCSFPICACLSCRSAFESQIVGSPPPTLSAVTIIGYNLLSFIRQPTALTDYEFFPPPPPPPPPPPQVPYGPVFTPPAGLFQSESPDAPGDPQFSPLNFFENWNAFSLRRPVSTMDPVSPVFLLVPFSLAHVLPKVVSRIASVPWGLSTPDASGVGQGCWLTCHYRPRFVPLPIPASCAGTVPMNLGCFFRKFSFF